MTLRFLPLPTSARARPGRALTSPLTTLVAGLVLVGFATGAHASTGGAFISHGREFGHPYQSGGIGHEQVQRLDRHAERYDLRVAFSEGKHNAYAAGLRLRVDDPKGHRVFALADAGPLVDVKLPAGHYRVVADFGGVRRSGEAVVKPGTRSTVYLHWPRDESRDAG